MENSPKRYETPSGDVLAYHQFTGKNPGIVFLGGFRSDMSGSKALALEAFCKEQNLSYLRFDYFAHGATGGDFSKGTIGRWTQNAVEIIEGLTDGPQLIIGSSMGGWLMLKTALAIPERVHALLGIAAAPDFTERLMWAQFQEKAKVELAENGLIYLPSEYDDPYPIYKEFIEDGRMQQVLKNLPLNINCPVRLLHGMQDAEVPWQLSFELAEALVTKDVLVSLVKDAGHRFSEADQIKLILATVKELLEL
jgi:pimeloyl-ACP methyl ester carboxylesterase